MEVKTLTKNLLIRLLLLLQYSVLLADSWGPQEICEYGDQGPKGVKGEAGHDGTDGVLEFLDYTNWKQCAWYSANGNDQDSNIYDCVFTKQYSDTALFVYYGGNLRLYGCSGCCMRWYITFNYAECSPYAIDGVVYQENTYYMNLHRHRSIQGHCENIAAGEVHVRLAVGTCSGYGVFDAYTGWNSASRIIIKEVPPSSQ